MKNNFSLLRYPGGKGRLYKTFEKIIIKNNLENKIYVEPFAGGFGVGIKLMLSGLIKKFIINDIDYKIYAFWYSVFNYKNKLINLIKKTPINLEEWKNQKKLFENFEKVPIHKIGFATLFLSRTNFSGILTAGPIGGYNQNGKYKINCRFNKNNIIELINKIYQYRSNVEIYNLDAKELIKEKLIKNKKKLFINFDPPYYKKGQEIYINFFKDQDHINLKNFIYKNISNSNWVITYDDCEFINNLYNDLNNKCKIELTYFLKNKRKSKEILIKSSSICF